MAGTIYQLPFYYIELGVTTDGYCHIYSLAAWGVGMMEQHEEYIRLKVSTRHDKYETHILIFGKLFQLLSLLSQLEQF